MQFQLKTCFKRHEIQLNRLWKIYSKKFHYQRLNIQSLKSLWNVQYERKSISLGKLKCPSRKPLLLFWEQVTSDANVLFFWFIKKTFPLFAFSTYRTRGFNLERKPGTKSIYNSSYLRSRFRNTFGTSWIVFATPERQNKLRNFHFCVSNFLQMVCFDWTTNTF